MLSCELFATGLWIRIHFLQIRIQLLFSMRIRIQPNKICNKLTVLYEVLK